MRFDRRDTMKLFGAATLTAGARTATAAAGAAAPAAFRHGVASGDPLQDRVILWTRVTPVDAQTSQLDVSWEIAEDAAFRRKVRRGGTSTGPERDFTVKVDVTGLRPMTRYHYRFRCGEQTSPVGQTQTLPAGKVDDLVIAVASCALYSGGFFNGYREIARLDRVDLVLHLGDYIYEYGGAPDQLGMSIGQKIGRAPTPANEAITLADYRERHSCYRLDPDLQAAHARAPWICVWDDHEAANDSWMGGAQNHQPNEGDWAARRTASVRAYYEWIPIREPRPGHSFEAINRSFELGDLATLVMLENRLVGRSRQFSLTNPQDGAWMVMDQSDPLHPLPVTDPAIMRMVIGAARGGQPIPAPYALKPDVEAIRRKLADPARTVLGAPQEAWLRGEIDASIKAGKPWQLIGNQVVMARTLGVNIMDALGPERWAQALERMTPQLRPHVKTLAELPTDIPFEFDGWNAYPAARRRMDEALSLPGAHPIVLSGDSHVFWVNRLDGAQGKGLAAEIGTTAITSSSLGDMLGGAELGPAYTDTCDEVLYCNQLTKGFAVVTLSATQAQVELVGLTTVLSRDYQRFTLKRFRILPGAASGIAAIEES